MIKKYQIFKEAITQAIQKSGLDVGIIYFILKDVFCEIERLYYTQIDKECNEDSQEQNS